MVRIITGDRCTFRTVLDPAKCTRLLSYLLMENASHLGLPTSTAPDIRAITLVGFGEAAEVFAQVIRASAWKGALRASYAGRSPSRASRQRAERTRVPIASIDEACRMSDLIVSVVTPSNAVSVARSFAECETDGFTYLDFNSVGPDAARDMQAAFATTPVAFVKGAILGPVPLQRDAVPLVLGGATASTTAEVLRGLGFGAVSALASVADPATVKMLWSVISKGIVALFAESLVAAERFGVADPLLQLVRRNLGAYGEHGMVERLLLSSITSGERRVVEMNEARSTLESVGVAAHSIEATIAWLQALSACRDTMNMDVGGSESSPELDTSVVVRRLSRAIGKAR